MLAACGRRTDVELVVAAPARGIPAVTELVGARLAATIVAPRDDQIGLALWDRHRAGRAFTAAGVDVVIGCKHLVPRTSLPTVLVVHDVLTITRAGENSLAKRVLLPAQYRRSLTGATRLVAVSDATRTRLGALDGAWVEKCDVVPNGMSTNLTTVPAAAPAGLDDDRAFALVVGDLSPRKNLGALTALWRDPPAGLTLVVVGPDSGTDTTVRHELLDLERTGHAIWIRGADDPALRWCYEHARVVLFPTREEGFGLPLLEAMTFHAPVVASDELALREVGGGAPTVTHVGADDAGAWRSAIEARVAPRSVAPPSLPPGAITWDEHTERLLAVARRVATA